MYSQISNHSSEGEGSPSHDTTKSLVGMVEASLLVRLADEETPLDSISVQVLGLSARANNALRRSNIESILELANCTESDLLSIRNIGITTLEEIRNKTNHYVKNILSSVENTDITRMSLLTYLEARGIEVTQSRSTVSDTFLNWICSIKKSKAQRDFDIFKEWFGLMSGEKKPLKRSVRNTILVEKEYGK